MKSSFNLEKFVTHEGNLSSGLSEERFGEATQLKNAAPGERAGHDTGLCEETIYSYPNTRLGLIAGMS